MKKVKDNLAVVSIVAAVSVIGTAMAMVAVKAVSKKLQEKELEIETLTKKLDEVSEHLKSIDHISEDALEIIGKNLDNNMSEIKEDIHRAVSIVIEKKLEAISSQNVTQAKECFDSITKNLEEWKKQIIPALTDAVITNVKDEMVKAKLDVTEDVIKAMLYQTSRGMIDEVKEELEEYQEGLINQYIKDGTKEIEVIKNGVGQILMVELMKNGLTKEQAEAALTYEKIVDMIVGMGDVVDENAEISKESIG